MSLWTKNGESSKEESVGEEKMVDLIYVVLMRIQKWVVTCIDCI